MNLFIFVLVTIIVYINFECIILIALKLLVKKIDVPSLNKYATRNLHNNIILRRKLTLIM